MREIKIVESSNTGLPNSYGYARRVLRVVECDSAQKGMLSERGVVLLWQSCHFAAHSRGPRSDYRKYLAAAEEIAAGARIRQHLGLSYDTPDGIVHDMREEKAGR